MHFLLTLFLFSAIDRPEAYPLMATIDPKLWDIPTAIRNQAQDALILKHATRVTDDKIHHYLLIHVLTNGARSELQSIDLGDHLIYLKGRVIDRTGKETPVDRDRDVTRVLNFQTRDQKNHSVIVVPSGLTPDSLLELSWSEKAEHGLPLDTTIKVWPVQEPVYCMEKTFEIDASTLYNFAGAHVSDEVLDLATRLVWTPVAAPIEFNLSESSGFTLLSYKNIPALTEAPFSDAAADSGLARIFMFRTTRFQGVTLKQFWHDFSQVLLRGLYGETFYKDGAYGTWVWRTRRLTNKLNAEEAVAVFQEFRKQINRSDRLDDLQRKGLRVLERDLLGSSDLLNQVFLKRYADPYSMGLIFYRVMVDCGFHPVLMFAPQAGMPFSPESLNPFAIDFLHPIIGIRDGGAWYTFAPAATECDSGYIPDRYRRNQLLIVDPLNNFATSFMTLDRPSWKLNRLFQAYSLQVNTNGAVKFNLAETRQGSYSAELRDAMESLSDAARTDLLTSAWQQALSDYAIGPTAIEGLDDFIAKVKVSVSGTCPPQLGKGRLLAIDPFPGMQPIIPLPSAWPENPRTEKIVLPENRGQASRCTLTLPAGWKVQGKVDWAEANAIGKVSYKLSKDGERYLVECQMIVEKSEFEASDEPLLRQYAEWVQRAMDQRIAVIGEVGS